MANEKEPFVSQGDRPEVSLKPESLISELTVRDLGALLGEHAKISIKHWKDIKLEKWEHPKLEKHEKWEHPKFEKHEKFEKQEKWEHPKHEKLEKWENIKHEKNEKLEIDIFQKRDFEGPPDPTGPIGDPGPIDRLVTAVSSLEEHVKQLDAQIKEIRGKMK
jgi:hypothetical protein